MALIDVVKYSGTPNVFAWKYPNEELGTWTQLIVNESQEAILVKGGKVVALLGRGRHTLNTKNIPLLKNFINVPFGGRSPFTAEIWYINKSFNLDIKWGTPSPIQIQDPKYGVFIPVRSNGTMGICIADSWKFYSKLVSTLPVFDNTLISNYFRGLITAQVKDIISSYVCHKQVSVVDINAYIVELSQHMKESISPVLLDFGVNLVTFYINDISVPENDKSVRHLKDALAKRAEMDIIGYNYQQGRSFDVLEEMAKNPDSSAPSLLSIGAGLGAGSAVGAAFNSMTQQIMSDSGRPEIRCMACGKAIPTRSRFCPECGNILEMQCQTCKASIPCTSKFCPECGTPL